MVFEAVHEDGDRGLIRQRSRGTNDEVGAACNRDAVGFVDVRLRLHVVGKPSGGKDIAGFAADDLFLHANRCRIHVEAAKSFDEACFELALQHGVHLHRVQTPLDLPQSLCLVEHHVQNRECRVAGRARHVMASPVGVHAAIAAVLQRVRVALAPYESVAGHAEDAEHVVRVIHHLLEISRAARDRVVQHQELEPHSGFRGRELARRHPQVVHRPGELASQPQLQRRDERAGALLGVHASCRGDEHSHRFGLEFPVEIQAIRDGLIAARVAGARMLDLALVVLHPSTPTTERKALSWHEFARVGGRRLLIVEAPEVHLAKRGRPDILEAERVLGIRGREGA